MRKIATRILDALVPEVEAPEVTDGDVRLAEYRKVHEELTAELGREPRISEVYERVIA